jgi:hypothetical protein
MPNVTAASDRELRPRPLIRHVEEKKGEKGDRFIFHIAFYNAQKINLSPFSFRYAPRATERDR